MHPVHKKKQSMKAKSRKRKKNQGVLDGIPV
jgi:hypothetical protein